MDPASYLALQLRLSQTEAMMNSRREELALQDQRLGAANEALMESDAIKDGLESQLVELQAHRGNLNLQLSKLQRSSKVAQQDLEESQSQIGLIENQFESLQAKMNSISKGSQAGSLTMNRLRAAVETNKDREGDRFIQIQGKIDQVEAALKYEIQKRSRMDQSNAYDLNITGELEINDVKKQLSIARKELLELEAQRKV